MSEILGTVVGGKTRREFDIEWRPSTNGGHYDILDVLTQKSVLSRWEPAQSKEEALEKAKKDVQNL
jgi:oligoribonuclease (3'-5' exoribonuclease)